MTAKIERKKGSKDLERLLKSVKDLHREKVEVGHFQSQGLHYSGMTYPELLQFWAIGVAKEGTGGRIRQDVRAQFSFKFMNTKRVAKDPVLKAALSKWAKNADKGIPTASLLDEVGNRLRQEYRTFFNVIASPHMKGTATPLFETGELAESTAYRTSKDRSIKES